MSILSQSQLISRNTNSAPSQQYTPQQWGRRDCPIMPGHILHNKYKIVREIDSGRFCTVWEAVDSNGYNYAIKVFKRGESNREYFENELMMLARVGGNAPNVVRHVDAFVHLYHANTPSTQCPPTVLIETNGEMDCVRHFYPCIVFELLGEHLLNLLRHVNGEDDDNDSSDSSGSNERNGRNGRNGHNIEGGEEDEVAIESATAELSIEDMVEDTADTTGLHVNAVKNITRQILVALSHLHSNGLIHTDIKPENILLCKRISEYNSPDEITVKLGDLGSSTPEDKLFSLKVGTHEYIAPEIVVGGKYSYPADMWSMGCLIYELLTYEPLFDLSETEEESESESSGYATDSDSEAEYDSDTSDENEYTTNLHHLLLMECVLGQMPRKAVRGKNYTRYFSKKGAIKNTLNVPVPAPTNVRELLSNYELDPYDVENASNLIEACLRYRPSERITADQALSHVWFSS